MNCPVCGGNTSVLYSLSDCEMVARKRRCSECGHIFYTSEIEEMDSHDDFIALQREKESRRRRANGIH